MVPDLGYPNWQTMHSIPLLSFMQEGHAAEALRLLCEAISLQNETTAAITSLEETQLSPLEAVFRGVCYESSRKCCGNAPKEAGS